MKAIAGNIIVKEPVEEKKSAGGIILQETSNKTPVEMVVDTIGPDVKTVQKNDHVLVPPYTGIKFTVDDVVYRVFNENEILVIL